MLLKQYNKKKKKDYKIKRIVLERLDKFLIILIKTVFVNTCLISSIYGNRREITSENTKRVMLIILRGYKVNIYGLCDDYNEIINPIKNIESSIFEGDHYDSRSENLQEYRNCFVDSIRQIFKDISIVYSDGISNSNQYIDYNIIKILLTVINTCKDDCIINEEVLAKVADMPDIIKIDNVLGGYEILKYDMPDFELVEEFKEITIEDIIEGSEKKIENYKGNKNDTLQLSELNDLIVE